MPALALDLRVVDVDRIPVVDPLVFVRLASMESGAATVTRVALRGQPLALRFTDGPSGTPLVLRVSPSRYHDGNVFARVDGDGTVAVPGGDLRLPRRSSAWVPVFTEWRQLPASFLRLQTALGESPAFCLGRQSAPDTLIGDRYDGVDPADESRVLAKLCLLNLYARLREEEAPGVGAPWFDLVRELLLGTRERLIAEVDEACWATVRRLSDRPRDGYRRTPVGDHKGNLEQVPGVSAVLELASVKTREAKANLQLTVARATRNGRTAFLLDTDMDENGKLLAHAFDLVKHVFTGGTHPVDISECLRAKFPGIVLGYELEPRVPVPDVRARIVAAGGPPEPVAVPIDVTGVTPPRQIAVLGDSVAWGQGLLNAQKMHVLVAGAFPDADPFPVTRLVAHSGATIGVATTRQRPPVDGEVPKAHPTILQQIASYPADEAASVDLLILNGGINDVDVRFILNPFTAPDDLESTTSRACGADLLALLRAAAARFPAARIAVLTYYPILSPQSRFTWGLEFLNAVGAPPPAALMAGPALAFPSIWDRIVDNCRIFHVTSTQAITAAVAQANAEIGGSRFAVADPGFGDEHAALAPQARLFGINWDLTPQDPAAVQRRRACDLFESDFIRREQCYRASAGHPNALGADAYARAIVAALAAVPA